MRGRRNNRAAVAFFTGVICEAPPRCNAFLSPHGVQRENISSRRLPFVAKKEHVEYQLTISSPLRMVYAPPGSGYIEREDESDYYPDTYDPMMEYPGTMRPGRTPENQAYENLPCGDSDPDPVPWPHFQEIEWHHPWEPPHPHPIPMEEFIEQHGRWASVEEEAQMRMDVRRGVRERRELEELEKAGASTLIVDEDEDEVEEETPRLDLGQGVESLIGAAKEATTERVDEEKVDDDADEVDFLLDLGLDADDGDDDSSDASAGVGDDDGDEPAFGTSSQSPGDLLEAMQSMIDMEGESGSQDSNEESEDEDIDLDIDLGLLDEGDETPTEEDNGDGDDDDDDDMGITMIGDDDSFSGGEDDMGGDFQSMTLDEYSSNEDMGDDEGFFDDGGFDYD
mmetsp:Transcript_4400/g.7688  ORF Transcript_4400/g.7688 Transcript_4400/m.7688 type:complete len:395 (-) Transcript_4400:116-1300(-)